MSDPLATSCTRDTHAPTRLTRANRRQIALDEVGEELDMLIRISPDGRVYFHDIPLGMLPIASALAPHDPHITARAHAAQAYRSPPQ